MPEPATVPRSKRTCLGRIGVSRQRARRLWMVIMIRPVGSVAAMAPYPLAELGDPAAVSLAQNESAQPPSPMAIARPHEDAARCGALYPDPDWRDLRSAIAKVHSVRVDHILCGAGSMELIGAMIRAFAGPGDEVLGTQYGYLFVATATQQAGATYVQAAEPQLRIEVDTLLASVTPRTRIVFLCNPGNPTGTRIPNAEIVHLRSGLPKDVLLVVDQAYVEFDGQDQTPVFDLVARGDTCLTRTFSKAYGLAGARVGWGVFPDSIAEHMRKLLNPNNISGISQVMATAAMHDQTHMRDVVARTAQTRDHFSNRVRAMGFDVLDSHTNFVLIRFASVAAAQDANERLLNRGYILRGMGGYGLPECLRATIGTDAQMNAVADVLERLT